MVIEALSYGTLNLKLKFKWTSPTHFCVNKTRQLDNQLEYNGLLVFYESQSCCIVFIMCVCSVQRYIMWYPDNHWHSDWLH